jgi:hypothetical protein
MPVIGKFSLVGVAAKLYGCDREVLTGWCGSRSRSHVFGMLSFRSLNRKRAVLEGVFWISSVSSKDIPGRYFD